MSYSRDFYSSTYTIPTLRESGWGAAVTELLLALVERQNATPQVVTADTATTAIDASEGHNVALSLEISTAIAITNMEDGDRLFIRVYQGGSFAITWSDTIRWRGGSAPTITTGAGAIDLITIYQDPDYGFIGDFGQGYA